jgi:hypothetical protein
VRLGICQALLAGLLRREEFINTANFAEYSICILQISAQDWSSQRAIRPTANRETPAMTRVSPKIAQLKPKAHKADVLEDLPELSVILADLKKILREDGLLPKYKH